MEEICGYHRVAPENPVKVFSEKCVQCARRTVGLKCCEVYPEGIPKEIFEPWEDYPKKEILCQHLDLVASTSWPDLITPETKPRVTTEEERRFWLQKLGWLDDEGRET